MIVITGPGRSGTTFLALLYRELGFDPKGEWNPNRNAGLEAKIFSQANMELASALGTVATPRRGPRSSRILVHLRKRSTKWLPASVGGRVNVVLGRLMFRRSTLDLVDWSRLDAVVAEHGERLKALAQRTEVVKDPQFCWTLQAWLASGASISAVVLALRPLESMVESRIRARMIPEEGGEWAKNNFAYGIGLAMAAVSEYRVPVTILRFPDFLDGPRELYACLPLPEDRTWDEFRNAFDRVHDATLVHDRR